MYKFFYKASHFLGFRKGCSYTFMLDQLRGQISEECLSMLSVSVKLSPNMFVPHFQFKFVIKLLK